VLPTNQIYQETIMNQPTTKMPLSVLAKKIATYLSATWVISGFGFGLYQHMPFQKALIKGLMPGGFLLIASFIAWSSPRVGAILLIAAGGLIFAYVKQSSALMTAVVALPPIAVGLFLFIADILDQRGR
jgi:hypothetical protein